MSIDNIIGGCWFGDFFGARLLYNFIFYLLSIVYALRHYITEVSMVSRLWYDKGIFCHCFVFYGCERVRKVDLLVNPELDLFGFG